MKRVAQTVVNRLKPIAIFLGVIWLVSMLNWLLPTWGLVPRTLWGLLGIPAMPFLHDGWGHLLNNTLTLAVLLPLLVGFRKNAWTIVAEIILAGGMLLWLFGRSSTHLGASGLAFGLIAFLILSGFLEKRTLPLLVSFAVGFWYGGALFWGILPGADAGVSWDGHLTGAVAGGAAAWFAARNARLAASDAEPPSEG